MILNPELLLRVLHSTEVVGVVVVVVVIGGVRWCLGTDRRELLLLMALCHLVGTDSNLNGRRSSERMVWRGWLTTNSNLWCGGIVFSNDI